MRELKLNLTYQIYDAANELDDADQQLIQKAIEATQKAYAPYSKFKVGAAVRLGNNSIIIGNNQENASYPAGLCAEQTALFHVGSNYPNESIDTIAIATAPNNGRADHPIAPCGICRQVLMEYEGKQEGSIRILLINGDQSITAISSAKDLMPMAFGGEFLK